MEKERTIVFDVEVIGRRVIPAALVALSLFLLLIRFFYNTSYLSGPTHALLLCGILAPVIQTITIAWKSKEPYKTKLVAIDCLTIIISYLASYWGELIADKVFHMVLTKWAYDGTPYTTSVALIASVVVMTIAFWPQGK